MKPYGNPKPKTKKKGKAKSKSPMSMGNLGASLGAMLGGGSPR